MSEVKRSLQEMGIDSISNKFRDLQILEDNKPDFKELDLDSPVSPLRVRRGVNGAAAGSGFTATSSCSSSSSGSVSGKSNTSKLVKSDRKSKNQSGDLTGYSETSPISLEGLRSGPTSRNSRPSHRRSVSAGVPLIYSGSTSFSTAGNYGGSNSTATSTSSNHGSNMFPAGNICPSGKILKSGSASKPSNRTDILGSGTANYGHGSIIRGGAKLNHSGINVVDDNVVGDSLMVKRAMSSSNPEEVKRVGNEMYRRGNFAEALSLYDRAISISPDNAAYRSNRAAALTALGKLVEAVKECEEAVRLDPSYGRAHQRLASLYMRLGQVEQARHHLFVPGQQLDQSELHKFRSLEKHLSRCSEARKIGDWKSVVRESDASIAIGADSSPQIIACKAEALLKLHQIEEAESLLSSFLKWEKFPASSSQAKFFGMLAEAYVPFVHAQIEMALGRFENAVAAAEKAILINYSNVEVARIANTVKMVARARSRGNDLFNSGRYAEACSAYGEGLKFDSSNSVLYCNRAICWSKLGSWEQSVEDCNQALSIQPNYTKALFRRAVSNAKLERWAEVVKDYEVLKRELPGDNKVTESLLEAQLALKKSHGDIQTTKFGLEVEEITGLDKFRAAISFPGISVVHFKATSNELCEEISPFTNMLCVRYPSIKFFKVDVEESLAVAKAENIRSVPTFKIYRKGEKVKEMFCPSHQLLEESVRNCTDL